MSGVQNRRFGQLSEPVLKSVTFLRWSSEDADGEGFCYGIVLIEADPEGLLMDTIPHMKLDLPIGRLYFQLDVSHVMHVSSDVRR